MSIDWNLLSAPRGVSNRGRFLVTRLAGLVVLLWLYSLQAQDKAVEPEKVTAPASQTVEPDSQKISIPPNVKDFGAVADGVADDSAAIQRAVDASLRPLHFPAGTYRVTRTIEIRLDKTGFLSITGDGLARILVDTAGPAFRIVGTHQGTADPRQ